LALVASESSGQLIDAPFREIWNARGNDQALGGPLDYDEISRLDGLARTVDGLLAAHAVDDMINSTSLVLVLQIGGARLLLPGDAEWGTWKLILANDKAKALLEGATFIKVGHHGSHNATPKTLVEEVLPEDIPAMISPNKEKKLPEQDPAGRTGDRLGHSPLHAVRSDRPMADLPAGFQRSPPDGNKWIDLELAC
jgi:hypothetical protein